MKVLELFAGTRSIGKAFEAEGHEVYSVEWDKRFENIDLYADILNVTAEDIREKFGQPDIIWASPDCFPMGTLIWTETGYRAIEDITLHTRVYTHKGNYKEVYKKFVMPKRDIYSVGIGNSDAMLVSSEHPYYVKRERKTEWVKVKDLRVGDKVGVFIENKAKLPRYMEGIRSLYNPKTNTTETWVEDRFTDLFRHRDFWWLIGTLFSSEGNWKQTAFEYITRSKTKAYKLYNIAVANGVKAGLVIGRGEYIVYINDKDLYDFKITIGFNKINRIVYELPKKLLSSFLDGLQEMSNVEQEGNSKYFIVHGKEMAYMLQLCFAKAKGQYLRINKIKDSMNDFKVGLLGSEEVEKGIMWVSLTEVNKLENRYIRVYNLSVRDDESYMADNIVVHNCTTFSMAGISHHRKKNEKTGELEAVSDYAKFCDAVDKHVMELIKELNPKYYFIENPVGGMRKMSWMQGIPRYTTTYCQYGDTRMKPTDIWTNHPNPQLKPPCHRGDKCHEAAPRGSKTGTQGLKNSMERSRIPQELCEHIVEICERGYKDSG